jgi:hypothetical protein
VGDGGRRYTRRPIINSGCGGFTCSGERRKEGWAIGSCGPRMGQCVDEREEIKIERKVGCQ